VLTIPTVGGFLGGILIGKGPLFRANYILLYGVTIKIVADAMFTLITPDKLILALIAGFVSMFGMGIVLVGVIVCVQLSCQDSHIGLATLVMSSIRSMGGSMAVTIYSSIMQNTLKEQAGPRVAKAIAPYNVPKSSLPMLIKLLIGNREKDAAKLPGVTTQVMKAAGTAIKWAWSVAFQ
jgi:hypothetical protein